MKTVLVLLMLAATAAHGEIRGDERMVIDFRDGGTGWTVVNDSVMGGVSRSAIERTDDGTGLFRGELSLEHDGGFASVRTPVGPIDPAAADGLEVRVRGDGRTYQLRLRTSDRFDGVAYRADIETVDGEWTTKPLPFADFLPTFRGRILPDAEPLDPARIRQLGFLLADRKEGSFALEIEWVRTWTEREES